MQFGTINLSSKILKRNEVSKDTILSKVEFWSFVRLGVPQLVGNYMGWFVFELQLIFIAKINIINKAALAASAIWVQTESTFAAIQSGWINATRIRK